MGTLHHQADIEASNMAGQPGLISNGINQWDRRQNAVTVSVSALFSPEAWIWRQVRHWHGCRTRSPEKGWITESRHSFLDRFSPPGYPNSFWQSEEMMPLRGKTMVPTCFNCDQERTTPLEGAVVGVAANPTWKWKKHEQSLIGRWFTRQAYLELVIFQWCSHVCSGITRSLSVCRKSLPVPRSLKPRNHPGWEKNTRHAALRAALCRLSRREMREMVDCRMSTWGHGTWCFLFSWAAHPGWCQKPWKSDCEIKLMW